MGLFTPPPPSQTQQSNAPSLAAPTPSADGAFEAPTRTSRARCYEARDTFFACLEKHGIIDSIKESEKAGRECGGEERGLGRECAGSWVTYFKQRRVMEFNKAQTLEKLVKEGAKPVELGAGPVELGAGPVEEKGKA